MVIFRVRNGKCSFSKKDKKRNGYKIIKNHRNSVQRNHMPSKIFTQISKLPRRYAQKGYTGYPKHKGSLCPRDNGENQKNWLHRGLLYCDANHHVRKKIACLSRWRVRMDKWTNNMNVWSAKTASIFIHGYASPSLLVATTSPTPLSSIILVEHHYQQLLLRCICVSVRFKA